MKFTTVEHIQFQTVINILKAISHVNSIYSNQGFKVITMLMYKYFEPLIQKLLDVGINLNTAFKKEHVLEVDLEEFSIEGLLLCVFPHNSI